MNEIVPILGGLLAGLILCRVPSRFRLAAGCLAAVVAGAGATFISGEYLISWQFLLLDIPLAAASSLASYAGIRQLAAGGVARSRGQGGT